MNFQIFRVLEPAEVNSILNLLTRQTFVDGKLTAKGPAREVKSNLQADRGDDPSPTEAEQIVVAALQRHQEFQAFTFSRRILLPTFNRYEQGMQYGWHVDSHVMGKGTAQIRTDLSMTVFLSDSASYDGGELILETPLGEQEVKLAAGEAIVYPSTSVHRVAPVTRGVRLAAISWIQSSIRDERMRAVLRDLKAAEQQAHALGHHHLSTVIGKSYNNLMRMAIEL